MSLRVRTTNAIGLIREYRNSPSIDVSRGFARNAIWARLVFTTEVVVLFFVVVVIGRIAGVEDVWAIVAVEFRMRVTPRVGAHSTREKKRPSLAIGQGP